MEGDFGGYPDNDEDQEAAAEAEYEEGKTLSLDPYRDRVYTDRPSGQ